MGWIYGYTFCALVMFAWVSMPPSKEGQEKQQHAFDWVLDRHGRTRQAYLRLGSINNLDSVFWPIALVWGLCDATREFEWYE